MRTHVTVSSLLFIVIFTPFEPLGCQFYFIAFRVSILVLNAIIINQL